MLDCLIRIIIEFASYDRDNCLTLRLLNKEYYKFCKSIQDNKVDWEKAFKYVIQKESIDSLLYISKTNGQLLLSNGYIVKKLLDKGPMGLSDSYTIQVIKNQRACELQGPTGCGTTTLPQGSIGCEGYIGLQGTHGSDHKRQNLSPIYKHLEWIRKDIKKAFYFCIDIDCLDLLQELFYKDALLEFYHTKGPFPVEYCIQRKSFKCLNYFLEGCNPYCYNHHERWLIDLIVEDMKQSFLVCKNDEIYKNKLLKYLKNKDWIRYDLLNILKSNRS